MLSVVDVQLRRVQGSAAYEDERGILKCKLLKKLAEAPCLYQPVELTVTKEIYLRGIPPRVAVWRADSSPMLNTLPLRLSYWRMLAVLRSRRRATQLLKNRAGGVVNRMVQRSVRRSQIGKWADGPVGMYRCT